LADPPRKRNFVFRLSLSQQWINEPGAGQMDLYRLLKDDHKRVNELFKQIAQTSDRAVKSRQRLFEQIRDALEAHGEAEEKHFYKALNRDASTKDMVKVARKDHREMRKRLAEISALRPTSRDFLDAVKVLQKQVRQHVREEERAIFPAAKQVLDKDQTRKITERIQALVESRLPDASRPVAKAPARKASARKATGKTAASKSVATQRAEPKRAAGKPAASKRTAPKRTASSQAPRAAARTARLGRRARKTRH
jgi:hemerythrin superfamily protein